MANKVEMQQKKLLSSTVCHQHKFNSNSDLYLLPAATESGAGQGDVLSYLLFIIFMDKCLRDIGPGMYGEETIMYADDVAVIADSITDIQEVANRLWFGMKANGMKVNTTKGKTELVVVSRILELHGIYMDYYKINQMENFYYSGVNIGGKNIQETRVAKYNRNVSMMYQLLKDRFLPRECKFVTYKTNLRPILLYKSEIWSLTSRTASKLQAAEMRVLRLIKGVTRRDRIRNA